MLSTVITGHYRLIEHILGNKQGSALKKGTLNQLCTDDSQEEETLRQSLP